MHLSLYAIEIWNICDGHIMKPLVTGLGKYVSLVNCPFPVGSASGSPVQALRVKDLCSKPRL